MMGGTASVPFPFLSCPLELIIISRTVRRPSLPGNACSPPGGSEIRPYQCSLADLCMRRTDAKSLKSRPSRFGVRGIRHLKVSVVAPIHDLLCPWQVVNSQTWLHIFHRTPVPSPDQNSFAEHVVIELLPGAKRGVVGLCDGSHLREKPFVIGI